jgi:hypothetical protein
MAQTRFKCSLTRAGEPACQSYARVTVTDSEGARARGCARHAIAAINGTTGAHVDWTDPEASTNGSAQPSNCPRIGANPDRD